jgi:hypothetical protein
MNKCQPGNADLRPVCQPATRLTEAPMLEVHRLQFESGDWRTMKGERLK